MKALAKATRRVPIGLDPGQAAGGGSGPSALQRVCTQPQKSLSRPQTNGPEAGTPASPCTRPDCGAPLAMMLTLGPRSFPEEVCSGPWASLWTPSGPALSLGTPSLPQASWGRGRQGVLGYFQLLVLTTLSENQVQMAGFPNTLQGWAEEMRVRERCGGTSRTTSPCCCCCCCCTVGSLGQETSRGTPGAIEASADGEAWLSILLETARQLCSRETVPVSIGPQGGC